VAGVLSGLSGGPAAQAGLKQGNIIVKWAGKDVPTPDAIVDLISKSEIGNAKKEKWKCFLVSSLLYCFRKVIS
jgi:S1-C subfamily serine protease